MWHSWRIVPTIQELVQQDAFLLDTPYMSPFCTGLLYSIGPNLELRRILCLLSWLLHQICRFPFDQKVETDSTDIEHVHYWMQLAIFGRDPKSAVVSFLERQEFGKKQNQNQNKTQTGLIVLFSRAVLAVSAEHRKKKSLVWFKNGDHSHGFQIQWLTFLDSKMVPQNVTAAQCEHGCTAHRTQLQPPLLPFPPI